MQDLDRAGDGEAPLGIEGGHARMIGIGGAIDLFGHGLHLRIGHFLDAFHIHHRQYRVAFHVGITQGDTLGIADVVDTLQQAEYGHREEAPVRHLHGLGTTHGIGHGHEALEGSEIATTHHHRIARGLGTDQHGRQALRFLHQFMVLVRVVDEQGLECI